MKTLLPILLIIVAVGLFFFQVNPLYSEVKQLRAESLQYDEALRTADELKEIRTDLAARLASFPKADLERLDHFLPRRLDTVRIILDIDGVAARNGVRIENMTVSDSASTAAASSAGSPRSSASRSGAGGANYNTVGVGFSFSATYPQGVQFIQDLQRSLRLFDTVSLTVKPSTKTEISSVFYDFNVKLETYWVNR